MCTFNFSIDDMMIDRIRPSFKDESAIHAWLHNQLMSAITQLSSQMMCESVKVSEDVAWFKKHPVIIKEEDLDEKSKYILER